MKDIVQTVTGAKKVALMCLGLAAQKFGAKLSDEQMAKIRHGNPVNLAEFSREPLVRVFAGQGELVCVASRVAGTLFQPKIVLCEQGDTGAQ